MKRKIISILLLTVMLVFVGCNKTQTNTDIETPLEQRRPADKTTTRNSDAAFVGNTTSAEISASRTNAEDDRQPTENGELGTATTEDKTMKAPNTIYNSEPAEAVPSKQAAISAAVDLPRQPENSKQSESAITEIPQEKQLPAEQQKQSAESHTQEKMFVSSDEKQPFDIDRWIVYAQKYALSIGLRLESSAVECWDNPITAGPHSIYLERDIQGMLNRYARDEDITDVWIWSESIGNGEFNIFIGYA